MPAEFVKGDIFDAGLVAFAQGVNCAGTMDAGIAVAFKKKWPRMFEDYRARCEDGRLSHGDVFVWSEDGETIYNLAIQEHWKKKATLAALTRALKKTRDLATHSGITRVGVPRIGTGLGGLEWPRVKSILDEVGNDAAITFVVFEQFVRANANTSANGNTSAKP
jgi:O-acetyl-ADP-ribose deacetylase (regulator of RNase III)